MTCSSQASVTLTRSLTIPTTGTGHQDARAATGTLTFYNGKLSSQVIFVGTVFTGQDGIKIVTNQTITIPAANPPQEGEANIPAYAINAGSQGNIATDDINPALSSDLLVRNLASFTGGKDARTYQAVAAQDIQQTISTLQATIAQALPLAFPLAMGERAYPVQCVTTSTPRRSQERRPVR